MNMFCKVKEFFNNITEKQQNIIKQSYNSNNNSNSNTTHQKRLYKKIFYERLRAVEIQRFEETFLILRIMG